MANDAPKQGMDDVNAKSPTVEGQPSLKMSMIHPSDDAADNSFFQNQSSFVFGNDSTDLHIMNKEGIEEYVDDDDVGFDVYVVNEQNFVASCEELAARNNFPARAIEPDTKEYQVAREKKRQQMKEKEKANLKKDDSAFMLKKLQEKKKGTEEGTKE